MLSNQLFEPPYSGTGWYESIRHDMHVARIDRRWQKPSSPDRPPQRSRTSSYTRSMAEVASRELRNHTRAVLDRVAHGEVLTVTHGGRPVAVLGPPPERQRWIPSARFAALLEDRQADAALRRELLDLSDETTDDLPL